MKELYGNSTKPVRVLTACGPFTTANNVQYLPLNDLLQIVVSQKPDVLILVSSCSMNEQSTRTDYPDRMNLDLGGPVY